MMFCASRHICSPPTPATPFRLHTKIKSHTLMQFYYHLFYNDEQVNISSLRLLATYWEKMTSVYGF